MLKKIVYALLSGALFALGLVVSGMTQPAKVMGFLNVGGIFAPERFGAWDASLAFVMGAALLVTTVAFAVTPRKGNTPWAALRFELPTRKDIDRNLVLGAALFGMGWGLAGYCPGPALASLLYGGLDVAAFVSALALGMWAAKRFTA
jgi:uncharacterized protein